MTPVPSSGLPGNTFFSGLGYLVPANLPKGINPVTWSGTISTATPGVSLKWQWAAAVYTSFNADNNLLGVRPVDANKKNPYLNSDHAGTPENYKQFVTGGARGGGGRITPEVSAELQALDHAGRRTQQLTSRSLNARDEFVVFRAAVAGLLECAQPARRVRASSRRFWGRRPLIEKRCEDASHSQLRKLSRGRISRTQSGRQCKMPWTHSDLSISV